MVIDWLQQHMLVTNPFGYDDLVLQLFFPRGAFPPDQWELFLRPVPQFAHCPTVEDAQALAFLMREECLPLKRAGNVVETHRQIFPILVSLERMSSELPLTALAHAAAHTWLEVLPLSPDAFLDLLLAEQEALLELLCWSVGSNSMVINLLQRSGLKENTAGRVLMRKLAEYEGHFSSTYLLQQHVLTRKLAELESRFSPAHLPQDIVLLSWLKIKPPGLDKTYLILLVDSSQQSIHTRWLKQFSSLISLLFLNGIVTKAIASTSVPVFLSLTEIQLSWSDARLKQSLDNQFDVALEIATKNSFGFSLRFHELFGPGVTEEETTEKLIFASHHSLARMLTLGNRVLQKHCVKEMPEKYLSPEELDDILKAT